MAIDILDEHEQGERVRQWLRNNGGNLITGIALGLAIIFGWQWWQGRQSSHQVQAAIEYEKLLEASEAKQTDKMVGLVGTLAQEFADTPYATLAALRLAESQLAGGDAKAALATLESAPKASDPALSDLVALRSARLLIADGQAEQALQRLAAIPAEHYPALVAETRGDAHLALDQRDEARAAYQDALTHLDAGAPTRQLLEIKLTDLGARPSAEPEA